MTCGEPVDDENPCRPATPEGQGVITTILRPPYCAAMSLTHRFGSAIVPTASSRPARRSSPSAVPAVLSSDVHNSVDRKEKRRRAVPCVMLTALLLAAAPAAVETDWHKVGDETADVLADVVRIDTQNPPGGETAAANAL